MNSRPCNDSGPTTPLDPVLTDEQIQTFLQDGVLVVEGILSPSQVQSGLSGLSSTLNRAAGVDTSDLARTGHGLHKLSSTNGSGGVLDVFYEDWKCKIATNPKLFAATSQLWQAAFCHQGETKEQLLDGEVRWQPYGAFDCRKGYCYMDRIGFRLPTELAIQLGVELQGGGEALSRKKKKSVAIQRSLTPHLDCCPPEIYSLDKKKTKWRPIQCFVSLTDTLEPNRGGFEAAKGFHRTFHQWAQDRPPTKQSLTKKEQVKGKLVVTQEEIVTPAPCVGEYTHIRPVEDREVMQQIQHVPVPAGSAVFFDNRIPHANAYRHDGDQPRCVVYCSFLPDVPTNQHYAARQLKKWKKREPPNDQWIDLGDNNGIVVEEREGEADSVSDEQEWLTPLARKLMRMDLW